MKVSQLLKKASFYFLAIVVPVLIIVGFLTKNVSEKIKPSLPTPIPTPTTQPMPWLKAQGRLIINEKKEKVILRGVNMASIDWGYEKWHPKAISHLTENWGVNIIRVRVLQTDFESNEGKFFQRLENEFLIPARKNKIYILLHARVRNNKTDLPDEKTVMMWQTIARKYRDDPTVLFDLLAEPHNTSQAALNDAYHRLIKTVREIHPKSLIFVTGLDWGRQINYYLQNPLPYKNLVYRSNPYNKPSQFEAIFGKISQTYPVFLGEFGAGGYPSMSNEDVQALLDYADQLELGWTAWNFHSIGCPCLLNNPRNFEPSDYGQIIKDRLSIH